MKNSRSRFTLGLALTCAAITFSLLGRAQAQTVTTLATFNGIDGNGPSGSVVQATDGNFYGTTDIGGPYSSYGYGTFFRVTLPESSPIFTTFAHGQNAPTGKIRLPLPSWDATGIFTGSRWTVAAMLCLGLARASFTR